jgi:Serine/threonine protein phosphatase
MRHVLTNVIGAREQVDAHLAEIALTTGDCFLLCSDGLYDPMGDNEVRRLLAGYGRPQDKARSAGSHVHSSWARATT